MNRFLIILLSGFASLLSGVSEAAIVDDKIIMFCIERSIESETTHHEHEADLVMISEDIYRETGRLDFLPKKNAKLCSANGWVIQIAYQHVDELKEKLEVLKLEFRPTTLPDGQVDLSVVQGIVKEANELIARNVKTMLHQPPPAGDPAKAAVLENQFVNLIHGRHYDFWVQGVVKPIEVSYSHYLPGVIKIGIDQEFSMIERMFDVEKLSRNVESQIRGRFQKISKTLDAEQVYGEKIAIVEEYLGTFLQSVATPFAATPETLDLISVRLMERIEMLENMRDEKERRLVPDEMLVDIINRNVVTWGPRRMTNFMLAHGRKFGGAFEQLLNHLLSKDGLEPYVFVMMKALRAHLHDIRPGMDGDAPDAKALSEYKRIAKRLAYETLPIAGATELFPVMYGSWHSMEGKVVPVSEGLNYIQDWMISYLYPHETFHLNERTIGDIHREIQHRRDAVVKIQSLEAEEGEPLECETMLTRLLKKSK